MCMYLVEITNLKECTVELQMIIVGREISFPIFMLSSEL